MINGKIHYKWSFSIAMLVYQRVPQVVPCSKRIKHGSWPGSQRPYHHLTCWLKGGRQRHLVRCPGTKSHVTQWLSSLGSKLVHIIEITVDNYYIIYIYYDDIRRCSMNSRSRFFLCNLPHHVISPTILNQNHPKENGLCLEIGYHGYHQFNGSSSFPWNGNFVA